MGSIGGSFCSDRSHCPSFSYPQAGKGTFRRRPRMCDRGVGACYSTKMVALRRIRSLLSLR